MKNLQIILLIGIAIVGVLAVFSIYLQQDEAIVEIKKTVEPNYHCLEKWNSLNGKIRSNSAQRLTDVEQKAFEEYTVTNCQMIFREWLPQTHEDWNYFIELESYNESICEKIKQSDRVIELSQEQIEGLKIMGCDITP